jgi:hypothetical protein
MKRKKPLKSKTPIKRTNSLKRGGKINHRSEKMKKTYDERRPFVEKILSENPYCQACAVFAAYDKKVTFVQNKSVDVHELIRRSQGGSILDENNVISVCRPCHQRIGNNPKLAFDLGLAKHLWDKE